MSAIRIPHYDNDTAVKLACGCETTWHDGGTLAKNIYAWCSTHGDTSVKTIHAKPIRYELHTHGGAREGAGRKPLPPGKRKVQTTVRLSLDDLRFLKSIDPNLSKAVHLLIESRRH
jgi:hypothetical protein